MKKTFILFLMLFLSFMLLCSCGEDKSDMLSKDNSCTISGSFTVNVREVIPDYRLDDSTPNVAIATEYQSYPFTLFVGEKIGNELIKKQKQANDIFVFTIEPLSVDRSKEEVQNMQLSSIVWEFPIKITECRIAEEDEIGTNSLQLTVE